MYHPSGLWGAEIIRMLGGAVLHNLSDPDYAPFTFVSFNSDTPDHVRGAPCALIAGAAAGVCARL